MEKASSFTEKYGDDFHVKFFNFIKGAPKGKEPLILI